MVEKTEKEPVEIKPNFVDYSVKIKSSKLEALVDVKPNTDEAFIHVEASENVEALHVKSNVSQLGVNKVDTAHFFTSQDTWKDKDELVG
ncbi:hypothetical protein MTR_2g059900 [Medicago truncatula]|uniref:Uncharacterized protein n=1 Tax=Medicago truncatula TaxID=3880 RepID=G7IGQ1_MEDTR|nr:hypothetical protein MTR_2g059900 [Medicago truncatula]